MQILILYVNSGVQDKSSSINHNLLKMERVVYIQQINDKGANNIGEGGKIGYIQMHIYSIEMIIKLFRL